MPEANPNHITPQPPPRRLLLSLAALAPLAAFPMAAANADNPDRELIDLCAEFNRLEAAYRAAYPADPPSDIEAENVVLAEQSRIGAVQAKLVRRMHEIRAATPEGQTARARSLAGWAPDLMETGGDTETMLRSAILRDLAAIAVVYSPTWQMPDPIPEDPHPDHAFIALCNEHIANIRACNTPGAPDALTLVYDKTRNAISETEPESFAGMVALARAAKAEAMQPGGIEAPSSTMAEVWAWDLVNDILRLSAGG